MGRGIVCIVLAFGLALAPLAEAQPSALGVVVQATMAQLGTAAATPGATIFDGDALSTGTQGTLRLRAGSALLYLGSESGVTLRRTGSGAQAEMTGGTLVVSTSSAAAMGITANGATIRPVADGPAVAQVTLAGPKELYIFARRGALEFSYADESEVIPEGASYRVMLDPQEVVAQAPAGAGVGAQAPPKNARRRRRGFIFFLWGVTGAVTAWAVHEALESPDRP